ncbi:hypothetical protein LAUMK13_03268 [Mycobacterium innocens]|uniref:Uncharacterized protein n=1 Tax=Mycobacterium innocens TaxID=2341083 RepID=A0A498Q697_9MYCO|nr:hypothetical protein LAUMK13_03268 [Mycobacterium innocens]
MPVAPAERRLPDPVACAALLAHCAGDANQQINLQCCATLLPSTDAKTVDARTEQLTLANDARDSNLIATRGFVSARADRTS